MSELIAPLEAILFASNEPLAEKKIMEIFDIDQENLSELISLYQEKLATREGGLQLRQAAGGWQLVTRPEYSEYIEGLREIRQGKLSSAALETLAIIAFKQPITKQEIEHIRGVRIEKVINKLLDFDLIREIGRKESLGRPILYGTTDGFLQCFGLNALADLPKLADIALEE